MRRCIMYLSQIFVLVPLLLGCSQTKNQDEAARAQPAQPAAVGSSDPWNGGSAAPNAATQNSDGAAGAPPAQLDAATNTISIALPGPRKNLPGTALRCAIEGDPLSAKNVLSLAMSDDGRLYISDDIGFRRYQPVFDRGCTLKLDRDFGRNGLLAPPVDKPTAQSLDGPVAFRSGGPTWSLASDGKKAIYAFDFLLGVYRIDGNRTTAVCPNLKSVRSIAAAHRNTYVGGGQVYNVNLRNKCATTELKAGSGTIYNVADQLWFKSDRDSKTIIALDTGGQRTEVSIKSTNSFAPGGFCYASAVTRCGDKICVIDNNCKKVEIYNQDGSFAAELKDRLFDRDPYGLPMGTSAGAAGLWLAATYHEADTYEGAVFLVPTTEL